MKECLDIFTRLLIATITFVVPIIINLLSTFSDGEKRRKELEKLSEKDITQSLLDEIQANPENLKITITESNKKLELLSKETNTELKKLNPITQFWNIFFFLSFSLISIMTYYLIKENVSKTNSIPNFFLITSLCSYLIGIGFIIRILYTIMNTKRMIN